MGTNYKLSWYMKLRSTDSQITLSIWVGQDKIFEKNVQNFAWELAEVTFIAKASDTQLAFRGQLSAASDQTVFLDNVQLSMVCGHNCLFFLHFS